jgi:hypothetical protein
MERVYFNHFKLIVLSILHGALFHHLSPMHQHKTCEELQKVGKVSAGRSGGSICRDFACDSYKTCNRAFQKWVFIASLKDGSQACFLMTTNLRQRFTSAYPTRQ